MCYYNLTKTILRESIYSLVGIQRKQLNTDDCRSKTQTWRKAVAK